LRDRLYWPTPVLALMLLSSVATAAQPPGGTPFERSDRDRDGKLSRDEARQSLRDRAGQVDTNKICEVQTLSMSW
jgi:hypothetical protein